MSWQPISSSKNNNLSQIHPNGTLQLGRERYLFMAQNGILNSVAFNLPTRGKQMPNEQKTVGNDITSLCMKCRQPQVHVITEMVQNRIARVQCRTCGSLHRYRNPDAPLKSPRKRSVKVSPEEVWGKVMNLVTSQKKIPYTFSGDFKVNDLIDHATFGLGVVTHLLAGDKIQVIFKDGEKILIARR
jgi:hypothetical protein